MTTQSVGLCFYCEDMIDLAVLYGEGKNDLSNPAVADKYVTQVEFHGAIGAVPYNGKDFVDNHIHGFVNLDAVKCKDGVVVVFNFEALKNPRKEKASFAKNAFLKF
jgi:hypothetical protein